MKHLVRFLTAITAISAVAIAAALYPARNEAAPFVILTILLASLIAAGVFTFRSWTADRNAYQKSGSKTVPTSLAALSSAAILAVYAAGYHRTAASSDGFSEHSGGRGAAMTIAANIASAPNQTAGEPTRRAGPPPASPSFQPEAGSRGPGRSERRAEEKFDAVINDIAKTEEPEAASTSDTIKIAEPSRPILAQNAPVVEVAAPQIAPAASDPGIQLTAPVSAIAKPKTQYKDGTYTGWGTCRHGDIQASVTIQDGKIVSSAITQCLTRYSCSWISNLPGQVVARQSPEVSYVSGASQSTDAFYYAIVDALSKARQ